MRKSIVAALFILLAISFCSAQVPGYRGLRFSLKYDVGIMPPTVVGRTGKVPMFYNNFSADYAVSRFVTLGLKYTFLYYNAPGNSRLLTGESVSSGVFGQPDYKAPYYGHTISFIVKKFLKRAGIAPVGRYYTYGAYFERVVDIGYYMQNDYYTDNTIKSYRGVVNYGGVVFGVGRNFVIARRMLLDVGFTINVPLYLTLGGDDIQGVVSRDAVLRNLMQVYIGFGGLIF